MRFLMSSLSTNFKKCNKKYESNFTPNSMYMLTYFTDVMYFNALHLPHKLSTYNLITLGVTHDYRMPNINGFILHIMYRNIRLCMLIQLCANDDACVYHNALL